MGSGAEQLSSQDDPSGWEQGKYPVEDGVIYAGARMRADGRWIRGTVDLAPGLVIGWFRAF